MDHSFGQVNERNHSQSPETEDVVIPLALYIAALKRSKKLIFCFFVVGIVLALLYITFKPQMYVAQATIAAAPQETGSQSSGLSSKLATASLMGGLSFGGANADTYTKYVQIIQSRRLAETLEQRHKIMENELYSTIWDSERKKWVPQFNVLFYIKEAVKVLLFRPAWQPPSIDDLSDRLNERILSVDTAEGSDSSGFGSALKNPINVVSVRYKDRDYAIKLLNYILKDSDELVRRDRLTNTTNRIAYLNSALKQTTDISMHDSLTSLLADQERNLMMLKVDKFFAVDVIDPPHADTKPLGASPIIILLGFVVVSLGIAAGCVFIMLRNRVAQSLVTGGSALDKQFPDPFAIIWRKMKSLVTRPNKSPGPFDGGL